MWRGRPRPRNLTTKPTDSSLLSFRGRSNSSREKSSHLRRLLPSLRKKRRSPARPKSPNRSQPSKNPGPGPRRNNAAKRPLLPASRCLRYRRNPPLSGKRHSHNRPPAPQQRLKPHDLATSHFGTAIEPAVRFLTISTPAIAPICRSSNGEGDRKPVMTTPISNALPTPSPAAASAPSPSAAAHRSPPPTIAPTDKVP